MRKLFDFLLFAVSCIVPVSTFAQNNVAQFTREHSYRASHDDSRNSAREKAMQEAQTLLLQQLGVIVEARQKMENLKFSEEITTYTLGTVKTQVVEKTEKWDGETYCATFMMTVDTAALFAYIDNVIKQKQQARADSLTIIKKETEIKQEAQKRQIAQIEQARADSIARVEKINDLQLNVMAARNLLSQEEKEIKPLKIEKENKTLELKEIQKQIDNSKKAFDNAVNASDAHTEIGIERIRNEAKLLERAKENYNKKLNEHNVAEKYFNEASKRVEAAKRILYAAQDTLAKETNIKALYVKETDVESAYDYSKGIEKKKELSSKNNKFRYFVFSSRPEFSMRRDLRTVGVDFELGQVNENGVYRTADLGFIIDVDTVFYFDFSAGFNIGLCLNKDGIVKNVFGTMAGIWGDTFNITGAFWKLLLGRNNNVDVTNKYLVGISLQDGGLKTTYSASIGYTLMLKHR